MKSNFLRKFLMLLLMATGWANCSWAQVAQVTDKSGNVTTYKTFGEALDALNDDKTIKLLTDYTITKGEKYIFSGAHNYTLDLNGHSLKFSDNYHHGIRLEYGAQLTIRDTRKTAAGFIGEIVSNNDYVFYLIDNSKLTIEGGKFKSSYPTAATFFIYGRNDGVRVTINHSDPTAAEAYIYNTGGLLDAQSIKSSDIIDIQNGYFSNADGIEDSYIMKGYRLYKLYPKNDCPYGLITKSTVAVTIGSNEDVRETFDNLGDAFTAVTASYNTVRLVKDYTMPLTYINNTNPLFFDLNGFALTASDGNARFSIGDSTPSDMTIIDNSEGKTGNITLRGTCLFSILSGSSLKIKDGTFINNSTDTYYGEGTIANLSEYATFIVHGGKFAYKNNFLSKKPSTSSVTVYGGYFNKDTYMQDENLSWTTHLTSDHTAVGNSGVEDYPYTMALIGAKLTYGENTVNAPVLNGVTIDLKDDESDYSAWLSKIQMMQYDEVKDIDFTIKKNFANTNWYAFCAPFDFTVTSELLENFGFAEIWDTELNTKDNSTSIEFINLEEGATISAYTPCLIKAKATGKQDIVFKGVTPLANATKPIDCSSTRQKFTFTGVMENTDINGKYALDSEDNALVYVDNADSQVTPLKFYMEVEDRNSGVTVQGLKVAMRVIGDETTASTTSQAMPTTQMSWEMCITCKA